MPPRGRRIRIAANAAEQAVLAQERAARVDPLARAARAVQRGRLFQQNQPIINVQVQDDVKDDAQDGDDNVPILATVNELFDYFVSNNFLRQMIHPAVPVHGMHDPHTIFQRLRERRASPAVKQVVSLLGIHRRPWVDPRAPTWMSGLTGNAPISPGDLAIPDPSKRPTRIRYVDLFKALVFLARDFPNLAVHFNVRVPLASGTPMSMAHVGTTNVSFDPANQPVQAGVYVEGSATAALQQLTHHFGTEWLADRFLTSESGSRAEITPPNGSHGFTFTVHDSLTRNIPQAEVDFLRRYKRHFDTRRIGRLDEQGIFDDFIQFAAAERHQPSILRSQWQLVEEADGKMYLRQNKFANLNDLLLTPMTRTPVLHGYAAPLPVQQASDERNIAIVRQTAEQALRLQSDRGFPVYRLSESLRHLTSAARNLDARRREIADVAAVDAEEKALFSNLIGVGNTEMDEAALRLYWRQQYPANRLYPYVTQLDQFQRAWNAYYGWTMASSANEFLTEGFTNDGYHFQLRAQGASRIMSQEERPFCGLYAVNFLVKNILYETYTKPSAKGWIQRVLAAAALRPRHEVIQSKGLTLLEIATLYHFGRTLYHDANPQQPELPTELVFFQLSQHLDANAIGRVQRREACAVALATYHAMAVTQIDKLRPIGELDERERRKIEYTYLRRDGVLFYDLETRLDSDGLLHDMICHVAYRDGTQRTAEGADPEFRLLKFATRWTVDPITGSRMLDTSVNQFLAWLIYQPVRYTCYAHNGANFDVYFICQAMMDTDLLGYFSSQNRQMTRSGQSILSINFRGHRFLDTCKFLAAPLSKLCREFLKDKPELWKHDAVSFWDGERRVTMKSTELCFYRPEIMFEDFIDFYHTAPSGKETLSDGKEVVVPSFRDVYDLYCQYDVISLGHVWLRYEKAIRTLTDEMASSTTSETQIALKKTSYIRSCITLGQHQVKVLRSVNYESAAYRGFIQALTTDKAMVNMISRCKVGGMSICDRPGLYLHPISVRDVRSLYPCGLVNSLYPSGKPTYYSTMNGDQMALNDLCRRLQDRSQVLPCALVQIEHAKFDCPPAYVVQERWTYRPVLELDETRRETILKARHQRLTERTWLSDKDSMRKFLCTTMLLRYMQDNLGLTHFQVSEALVWKKFVPGAAIHGRYVTSLYATKALQDRYKTTDPDKYNNALREAVKLAMNCITGKLGQSELGRKGIQARQLLPNEPFQHPRPGDFARRHPSLTIEELAPDDEASIEQKINAVGDGDEPKADMTPAYIFDLEYSKCLMFQYLRCLPSFDDLIAVETDSIHMETRHDAVFEANCERMRTEARGGWCMPWKTLFEDSLVVPKDYMYPEGNCTLDTTSQEYVFFPSLTTDPSTVILGSLSMDKRAHWAIYLGKKKYYLQGMTAEQAKAKGLRVDEDTACLMRMAGFRPDHLGLSGERIRILFLTDYIQAVFRSLLWRTETQCDPEKLAHYRIRQTFRGLKRHLTSLSLYQIEVKRSVMPNPNMNVYYDPVDQPPDEENEVCVARLITHLIAQYVPEMSEEGLENLELTMLQEKLSFISEEVRMALRVS